MLISMMNKSRAAILTKNLNFNNLWRSFFDQYSAHHNYLFRKFQTDHHIDLQNKLKTKYKKYERFL